MLSTGGFEVAGQGGLDDGRQHRDPVLVAPCASNNELLGAEVDVLNPELAALQDTKARAVEQGRHEAGHAAEPLEHGADLAGLSQFDVARVIGVTREAVSYWEAGYRTPRPAHAVAYQALLNRLAAEPP
jgi:hypothetical protein